MHDFSRSRQLKVSQLRRVYYLSQLPASGYLMAETRFPELLSLLDKLVSLAERSDRTTGLYRVGPFVNCQIMSFLPRYYRSPIGLLFCQLIIIHLFLKGVFLETENPFFLLFLAIVFYYFFIHI